MPLAVIDPHALLQWLGRTHVIVVHFPLALLLVAGLAELWRMLGRNPERSPFAVGCVLVGTIGAAWAIAAGLAHQSFGDFQGEAATTLQWHLWLGLAAGLAGLITLLCARAPLRIWRGATFTSAALVGLAGHFGGTLTHGPGYLTDVFTAAKEKTTAAVTGVKPAAKTLASAAVRFPASGKIDFVKHVQPILADSCVECHGPTVRRGGLRLDSKASALKGGKGGPAVVPHDAAKSTLIARIAADLEPIKRMPQKKPPLSAEHAKILRAWIEQGAPWPDAASYEGGVEQKHWAYVAPQRTPLPAVKNATWPRNPIDHFVLARLEAENLTPSPAADRATLLRRVYLDLIGLPPTPAEADEFLSDLRPDAYERVVDRLLASPRYGERWARPWLDLARYADSNGYEKDALRSIWPWRDWVIDALNRDMPFDQFTIEQLAGDLLPEATLAQKIATGFHRNTMLNQEGGTDPEEFRNAAIVDRVNTTATVWLGSTLACAQCHDHKFDAFSQKEYYQLFAFFNQTADESKAVKGSEVVDISARLELPRPNEAELRRRVADLEKHIATADLTADVAALESAQAAPGWVPLEITAALSDKIADKEGAALAIQSDGSVLASGSPTIPAVYRITGQTKLTHITGLRVEVLPDASLPADGPGRNADGDFTLSRVHVVSAPIGMDDYLSPVVLHSATADFETEKYPIKAVVNNKADDTHGWRVTGATGRPHAAAFAFEEPVVNPDGIALTVALHQVGKGHGTIGRVRLYVTAAPVPAHELSNDISDIFRTSPADRTPAQREQLVAWLRPMAPSLRSAQQELATLKQQLATPITTLVLEERKEPRETFVQKRGNFLSPGDKVSPDVPAALPPLPKDAPRNRLALARWLVSADNPLTARVTVNRMWEAFFGRGIVATSEDFGIQGAEPTHPELLDWLATEFVRGGWRMKAMHRLIVTSATYRQSSAVTPALLERDPYNTLLAHGPRFRLEAELIRDQALAVAGLLSPKMGGPGVYPPQPVGIWNFAYNTEKYIPSVGEDRWRRGIYTVWRRSAPFPSFLSFDATSREAICTRRSRSNTPLQALTTLNDPQFFEAAVALARRMAHEAGDDASARIVQGFRLAVVRLPRAEEVGRLLALFREQRANFEKDPAAAEKLVRPYLAKDDAASPELAAWTVVANVLLNLDETLTKG
jgi:uncharacterized membrane protein